MYFVSENMWLNFCELSVDFQWAVNFKPALLITTILDTLTVCTYLLSFVAYLLSEVVVPVIISQCYYCDGLLSFLRGSAKWLPAYLAYHTMCYPVSWSYSFSWCIIDGYRGRDHFRGYVSKMDMLLVTFTYWRAWVHICSWCMYFLLW